MDQNCAPRRSPHACTQPLGQRHARTHAHEPQVPAIDSKAACLTVDPELFFPIGNTGPAISQVAEAKAVCRECDVKGICLQWAIDNNQDSGVWGGMSEEERRSLKRRAARARRAGC